MSIVHEYLKRGIKVTFSNYLHVRYDQNNMIVILNIYIMFPKDIRQKRFMYLYDQILSSYTRRM